MTAAAPTHSDERTLNDTIAAVVLAGRMIDALKHRLALAETAVSRLEGEKQALSAALEAASAAAKPSDSDDALRGFLRGVDASFHRTGARH